ncbi:MAG TPA: HprK-related kinase A [Nitrosomonas sp.]|nr:HprK-related kinase A [Nitrosomonas sp.]HMW19547.1 HprK-related kinase A [Nitrosomonas sp.]HMW68048.1 HprK-related kinase A [Nitrosomonas sp.]HMY89660.1 HprK-related kinase A [Nitrosomonas sp.]HNA70352.1 HprK-related kinase A [Nitrosomonas sp.]
MIVEQIPVDQFIAQLSHSGIRVKLGPINVLIRTKVPQLAKQLHFLYTYYDIVENEIVDIHTHVLPKFSFNNPFSSFVRFTVDGQSPFPPFPADQALAALEWGINLVIAVRVNHLLMFHSAAVERNGSLILLPAWPGSGKTTLCTALIHRGYRLFSDEFGLMDPISDFFTPIPRLMPLKNQSIQVIRDYLPEAVLGEEIYNTQKGTIAHVRPPRDHIFKTDQVARAKWIIFPKWTANAPLKLEPLAQSEAFLLLASNSFNYEILGESAFRAVTRLIRKCQCYQLVYSDLDSALAMFNKLTDEA